MSITDNKTLRILSTKFYFNGDVLYKRNYDSFMLKCMDRHEVDMIIKANHEGCEGVHANEHVTAKKILRSSYYCTTMEVNSFNYVRRCHKCQIYPDKIHVSPTMLNVLTSP